MIVGNLLCLQTTLMAQESRTVSKVLAQTPPMGWNSWDSYGLRINEQQFRENVEAMATKLKPFGYTYAVIDEGWYMVNPEDRPKPDLLKYAVDENGRFIPVTVRFPSALQNGRKAGFQELRSRFMQRASSSGFTLFAAFLVRRSARSANRGFSFQSSGCRRPK